MKQRLILRYIIRDLLSTIILSDLVRFALHPTKKPAPFVESAGFF
jgi:hypothetical protein